MTDSQALRRLIQDSGLKIGYIAEQLELSHYGFTRKIDNRSVFTAKEIDKLCSILNITKLSDKESIFFKH